MKAPLHRRDRNVAGFPNHQSSRVTFDGGVRKAGDFVVTDRSGVGQFICECAQAAAQHDRNRRCGARARMDELRRALRALA